MNVNSRDWADHLLLRPPLDVLLRAAHPKPLESGKRGPSETTIKRLAKVLGFDARKLFFLARPHAHTILNLSPANPVPSAKKPFESDRLLRHFHNISDAEMELLSHVASLGEVRSAQELIYVLNAVRIAIYPASEIVLVPLGNNLKTTSCFDAFTEYLTQRWECCHTSRRCVKFARRWISCTS